MVHEIRLVVTDNNKVLETVIKETSTHTSHLIQSLEEFQLSANVALTKLIEKLGGSGDGLEIEENEESDDDEDDNAEDDDASPKKKRK